jgi:hypothetical protein
MRFFLSILVIIAGQAMACDNTTVRGAAFYDARDIHRLVVIGRSADPETDKITRGLETWVRGEGPDLNLRIQRVSTDDPDAAWEEYGIPSAPPSVPVVVLSGTSRTERRFFLIDHWEPAPTPGDLESLAVSPAREELCGQLGINTAVLLSLPSGEQPAASTQRVLDAVVAHWRAKPLPVSVVQVDRRDPRERVLVSFIGGEEDKDCVGIAFGPGRLMQPLLGDEIQESRINEMIEQVTVKCTCLRPASSYGVDLPLKWNKALSDAALPLPTLEEERVTAVHNPVMEKRPLTRIGWTLIALAALVAASTGVLLWRRSAAA